MTISSNTRGNKYHDWRGRFCTAEAAGVTPSITISLHAHATAADRHDYLEVREKLDEEFQDKAKELNQENNPNKWFFRGRFLAPYGEHYERDEFFIGVLDLPEISNRLSRDDTVVFDFENGGIIEDGYLIPQRYDSIHLTGSAPSLEDQLKQYFNDFHSVKTLSDKEGLSKIVMAQINDDHIELAFCKCSGSRGKLKEDPQSFRIGKEDETEKASHYVSASRYYGNSVAPEETRFRELHQEAFSNGAFFIESTSGGTRPSETVEHRMGVVDPKRFHDTLVSDGRYFVDVSTNRVPRDGFLVAVEQKNGIALDQNCDPEDLSSALDELAQEKAADLTHPGFFLGCQLQGDKYYLDVYQQVSSKQKANKLARESGTRPIFDVSKQRSCPSSVKPRTEQQWNRRLEQLIEKKHENQEAKLKEIAELLDNPECPVSTLNAAITSKLFEPISFYGKTLSDIVSKRRDVPTDLRNQLVKATWAQRGFHNYIRSTFTAVPSTLRDKDFQEQIWKRTPCFFELDINKTVVGNTPLIQENQMALETGMILSRCTEMHEDVFKGLVQMSNEGSRYIYKETVKNYAYTTTETQDDLRRYNDAKTSCCNNIVENLVANPQWSTVTYDDFPIAGIRAKGNKTKEFIAKSYYTSEEYRNTCIKKQVGGEEFQRLLRISNIAHQLTDAKEGLSSLEDKKQHYEQTFSDTERILKRYPDKNEREPVMKAFRMGVPLDDLLAE